MDRMDLVHVMVGAMSADTSEENGRQKPPVGQAAA
jgi:hypothetical protein